MSAVPDDLFGHGACKTELPQHARGNIRASPRPGSLSGIKRNSTPDLALALDDGHLEVLLEQCDEYVERVRRRDLASRSDEHYISHTRSEFTAIYRAAAGAGLYLFLSGLISGYYDSLSP